MVYTVQKLATLAGVSVRTLHHYDEIGLLKPSKIGENGYRYYEEKELFTLQQILFFKELDFPLDQIKQMLQAKHFNMLEALQDHKKLIFIKKKRLERLLITISKTIDHMKNKNDIKDEELFGDFNEKQMDEYKEEARKRWGNTDAWKQSQERTKHWTKADYKRIAEEGNKFTQELADAMDKDIKSKEVQDLIAQHYQGIQTFYDCSYEMYRGLGDLYIQDPRFKAFYEKFRPGLAQFMHNAMNYFCDTKK